MDGIQYDRGIPSVVRIICGTVRDTINSVNGVGDTISAMEGIQFCGAISSELWRILSVL